MKSHELDYQIFGDDMQMVTIGLDPNETVVAEAGAMLYMEDDIDFKTKMGDGSQPEQGMFGKLLSAGKRMVTGESIFMTHFTNLGSEARHVSFSAPYPGRIIPVNMPDIGGELICQRDAFLCAALGTEITVHFNRKLGAGFFGGEGFILQKLRGDGLVFLHAGGTIIQRDLANEKLRVDTGCIVGFEPSIEYSIERAGNMKSMFLGGEGLFLATLHGTGRVWLQSLPFSTLAGRIASTIPSSSS